MEEDSLHYYKLQDERVPKDMICWICGTTFAERDLIVSEKYHGHRTYKHARCFNIRKEP